MADYLETYATRFELPVRSGASVEALERTDRGYVVAAGDLRLGADNVIVATGVFQHEHPIVPEFADELDPAIRQLHSAEYSGPEQLRPGRVLVVGAAHSGGDIAFEVARAGHPTVLSGRDTGQIPVPLESRRMRVAWPVMRFLWTRVLTVHTPMGRKVKHEVRWGGGPLVRVQRADLEAAGVERVLERTVGVRSGMPVLADGRVLEVENVIWCTGFRNDWGWIRFPMPRESDGYPAQDRGAVTSLPGLYFVGMPFLDSFSSMLVLGAGRDGQRVAKHIAARATA
jgi:putative flavoprotein involved in K+ transport